MKKTILFTLITGLLAVTQLTMARTSVTTQTTKNTSDNWKLIKEENGIKVHISQFTSYDQTIMYKIKFENSSNKTVLIKWSLTNTKSGKSRTERSTTIMGNESLIINDRDNPINSYYGEKLEDLTINLNFN